MTTSKCVVCKKPFRTGDTLQAFLRCPDDPNGSWTTTVVVDEDFQKRFLSEGDLIQRKHSKCSLED